MAYGRARRRGALVSVTGTVVAPGLSEKWFDLSSIGVSVAILDPFIGALCDVRLRYHDAGSRIRDDEGDVWRHGRGQRSDPAALAYAVDPDLASVDFGPTAQILDTSDHVARGFRESASFLILA